MNDAKRGSKLAHVVEAYKNVSYAITHIKLFFSYIFFYKMYVSDVFQIKKNDISR